MPSFFSVLLLDRVRVSTRRLLLCVVEFVVVEFSRQSETDYAKIYAGVGARGARNMVRLEPFERLGRSVSRASENRGRSGEVEGEVSILECGLGHGRTIERDGDGDGRDVARVGGDECEIRTKIWTDFYHMRDVSVGGVCVGEREG